MKLYKPAGKLLLRQTKLLRLVAVALVVNIFCWNHAMAQQNKQMVRLAKVSIDPFQLQRYNTALKEQMATAVRVEPGVLTYYAVADKKDPSQITILEIYADTAAYKLHIETAHFKKYKDTVKDMVRSLELTDVTLVGVAKKPGKAAQFFRKPK